MANFGEELFNLYSLQDVKLSKKEKKILKFLDESGSLYFYDLMEFMDMKPSSFNKHLDILETLGFVSYDENEDTVQVTDLGNQYLSTGKKERKENKKFLRFVESLSDEELEEFKKVFEEAVEDSEEETKEEA